MDFFKLFTQAQKQHRRLCFEFGFSSITDYTLSVYDATGKEMGNWGDAVVKAENCDMRKVLAEGYVGLANYLSEKYGGY